MCIRLAIVTETFPPEVNGVAMTFGVITSELARRGHRLTVYRPAMPGDRHREAASEAIEVVPMPGFAVPGYPAIRLGFPAARTLRRAWRAQRPDLVHVVTEGPLGASAISAARSLGIPVTSSYHTHFHSYTGHYGAAPLARLTLAWLRRVHNRTRRTFAPTPALCTELTASGFANMSVLSRGVDLRSFSPARRSLHLRSQWRANVDTPVVLHVGRMAPEKNYDVLFRIYARMKERDPRLRFVLAGEGPLQQRLRREHPDCIFAGFLSRQDIGAFFASADIYIHASETETFGNVLTEAMASGLACAGYDYAAATQFLRHDVNGLSCPLGDEAALTTQALRLLIEPGLRERLSAEAPRSLQNQSWEAVVARFEQDLLLEISASKAQ